MITVATYVLSYGPGGLTRSVRVTVQSDADGIGSLQARDHSGVPLGELRNANCARAFTFDVLEIPTGQFPIFVWADECTNGEPSNQLRPYGPYDPPGGSTGGGTRPDCSVMNAPPTMQCLAAISEARRLRNLFISTCDTVRNLRNALNFLIALAILFYVLAALFTLLAIAFFVQAGALAATPYSAWAAPIATVTGIVALVIATAWTAAAVAATATAAMRRAALMTAERNLETIGEEFRTAAMNVNQSCCPSDFLEMDVTLPTCR